MAELSLTGKLIHALETKSGISQRTGNKWKSRDYVLEVPGQYPKKFVFNVYGEERLKEFNLHRDEEVTVFFDIDAHEWNGRWFNEIRAYRVERVGQQQVQQPAQQPAPAPQPQSQPAPSAPQTAVQQQMFDNQEQAGEGSADDLPF